MALLGLAAVSGVAPAIGKGSSGRLYRPAMLIDVNRCMGCHSCVIACKEQNHTPKGFFNTRIETVEQGLFPRVWNSYMPEQCHHCDDAPCVDACQADASQQLSSGLVVVDWEKCTGDGACIDACPYGARFLDPQAGNKADKCDFCAPRLAKGLEPACVENCPSHARIFGDLEDPQGEFASCLAEIAGNDPASIQQHGERLFYTHASKG